MIIYCTLFLSLSLFLFLSPCLSLSLLAGNSCHNDDERPDCCCKLNLDDELETPQEVQDSDNQFDLPAGGGDSLESSDAEDMQFWTQAATELDDDDDDDDRFRGSFQEGKKTNPVNASMTSDLRQPWVASTDADDFIDQLLMTGTEGETISSSPNLPDISPPAEEVHLKSLKSCLNTRQTDSHVCSNKPMDSSCHDNDRCPTPPLPLPRPRPTSVTKSCLLYTSPSPRDATLSRMPSSA